MLEHLSVRTFKSLDDVTVDLGLVNVFIGANGSGKSNLLEALGILSAAADARLTTRPCWLAASVPVFLHCTSPPFQPSPESVFLPICISVHAAREPDYEVSLHNPLKDPTPAWRFKTELWEGDDDSLVGRSPAQGTKTNPERG